MTFEECDSCRAKPGAPTLCHGCLSNRARIAELEAQIVGVAREVRTIAGVPDDIPIAKQVHEVILRLIVDEGQTREQRDRAERERDEERLLFAKQVADLTRETNALIEAMMKVLGK